MIKKIAKFIWDLMIAVGEHKQLKYKNQTYPGWY